MDFWFQFLDIHMNEKELTCYDCHGFKWKNINIYPILIVFFAIQCPFWLIGLTTPIYCRPILGFF